jgi:cytochrome c peroxidase
MKASILKPIAVASVLILTLAGTVAALGGAFEVKPYDREQARQKFRRPATTPFPKDNGHTVERVALGKTLFFDPRLSGGNAISCASCHNPGFSWGDGLPKAVGHGTKELGRRTPTILNVAWGELYFWDGRAASLEEQALGPIASPGEMNLPIEQMVAKVKGIAGYHDLFEKAYPGEGISEKVVGKAIATFERTIVSAQAPFDHWIAGREDAISEKAKSGFDLFNSKAACFQCHVGWNFTDDGFHDIGLRSSDKGRGAILEQVEGVQYAKKTPTLRNAEQRAPFMHDGSERTLEDVVRFYNRGGDAKRPSLDIHVKPLELTDAEIDALCEFMRTLSSRDSAIEIPILPR